MIQDKRRDVLKEALLVTGVALVVRVLLLLPVLLHPGRALLSDSVSYWEPSGFIFSGNYPFLFRPPGYPLLIAFCRLIWDDVRAVALLGVLVDAGAALLVWATARRINPRAGPIAGLIYAVLPGPAFYSTKIMSETGFAFLTALSLFLALKNKGLWTGIASASSNFLRPLGWITALFSSGYLFLRRRFRAGALTLGVFALLAGAWMLRNRLVKGTWAFSGSPEAQLFTRWCPYALLGEMSPEGATGYLQSRLNEKLGREVDVRFELDDPQVLSAMGSISRGVLMSHPLTLARFWVLGVMRTLLGPPVSGRALHAHLVGSVGETEVDPMKNRYPGTMLKALTHRFDELPPGVSWPWLLAWILELFILVAAALGFLRNRSGAAWLLGLVAAGFILAPGPTGYGRFMVPAGPCLAVLAGLGLVRRK